jgi:ribosomal protein S18 acetylase RimI-like enzyme
MHDVDAIWRILEPIIRAGETYALPPEMTREDALAYWFSSGHEVFVADDAGEVVGEVVGTYYLRANQQGGGAHVANCAYMTASWASGGGIGRAMAMHSLDHARARGFRAMQFNFVVASNERAVRLWQRLGFQTIGRLPAAFRRPGGELVDALVMHRIL